MYDKSGSTLNKRQEVFNTCRHRKRKRKSRSKSEPAAVAQIGDFVQDKNLVGI